MVSRDSTSCLRAYMAEAEHGKYFRHQAFNTVLSFGVPETEFLSRNYVLSRQNKRDAE